MTRSVYIIGGAGTGKSTFVQELLHDKQFGPFEDLHSKPNSRGTQITLRGHYVGPDGLYIGCMRESFPGTDGLDRLSYIPGEEWLEEGHHSRLGWMLGEGATLAVHRFLSALHSTTDLLVVHLYADDFVKELRFLERGSNQKESFVTASATRSRNLLEKMKAEGAMTIDVDTADTFAWLEAQTVVREFLRFS